MKSPLQVALGPEWDKLPAALQAHYSASASLETGYLDVEFPWFMKPVLLALRGMGVLLSRRGKGVSTSVSKHMQASGQSWRRVIRYQDGRTYRFDTLWMSADQGHVIEFVNPILGLRLAPWVANGRLHYRGVCFVLKLGQRLWCVPEWLLMGHSTIVEEALGRRRFAMDFRLTHPVFGLVFRYAGQFHSEPLASGADIDASG